MCTTGDTAHITTGDTAHIDTIFKFLPHTRVNMGASIFFTAAMIRVFRSARSRGNGGTFVSLDYAENWPEHLQRHLQRLMDDHLISACTDTQFQ